MTNPESRQIILPRTVKDALEYFVLKTMNKPLTPRRLDNFYRAWSPRIGESNMPELKRRVRVLVALVDTPPPISGDYKETVRGRVPVTRNGAYDINAYRDGKR